MSEINLTIAIMLDASQVLAIARYLAVPEPCEGDPSPVQPNEELADTLFWLMKGQEGLDLRLGEGALPVETVDCVGKEDRPESNICWHGYCIEDVVRAVYTHSDQFKHDGVQSLTLNWQMDRRIWHATFTCQGDSHGDYPLLLGLLVGMSLEDIELFVPRGTGLYDLTASIGDAGPDLNKKVKAFSELQEA
jgi:hypothetical protein